MSTGAQAFNNCFSADTEVLTEDGWKYFFNCNKQTKFATLNTESYKLEWQQASKHHAYLYTGPLHHYNSKLVDLMVTPEHNMLLETRKNKRLIHRKSKDLTFGQDGRCFNGIIPRGAKTDYTDKKLTYTTRDNKYTFAMEDWLQFLACYISDGSCYWDGHCCARTQIGMSPTNKGRIIVTHFLDRYHIPYSCDETCIYISGITLYNEFHHLGTAAYKHIPAQYKKLSPYYLLHMINALYHCDGYFTENSTPMYFTVSTQLRDDVMEIIAKSGLHGAYTVFHKKDTEYCIKGRHTQANYDLWAISIYQSDRNAHLFKPEIIDYDNYVYCASVPNRTLLVRRNGKMTWCGNCDTLLAPFVYMDRKRHEDQYGPMSDEQCYTDIVKQAIQSFIYNINTTSRWGGQCVPDTYQCLTPNGWKCWNELSVGDEIYVQDIKTGVTKRDKLLRINHFEHTGDMVSFTNRKLNFITTGDHRVVREVHSSRKSNNPDECRKFTIDYAKDLIDKKTPVNIPLVGQILDVEGVGLDTVEIPNQYVVRDNNTNVLTIYEKNVAAVTASKLENWKGYVWCPTTNTGTFICRNPENMVPFITGNCPFTNITLDVTCPKHMQNEAITWNGKKHDSLTYGEFQKEMDMINKAFVEVMTEGDNVGRIFSFPIPTYNVTEDFPWDSEVGNGILKMTAKYGTPYFQNFINSDLHPEDVRSMCPLHANEVVPVIVNGSDKVSALTMEYIYQNHFLNGDSIQVYLCGEWYSAGMTINDSEDMLAITTSNGVVTRMDGRHLQPIRERVTDIYGYAHSTIKAKDLKVGQYLPYCTIGYRDTIEDDTDIILNDRDVKWYEVIAIEKTAPSDKVYCFVVDNNSHLFQTNSGLITHNCRLQMDLREIRKMTGGLFGAGDLVGSIGVCTLNLSKFGYLAKTEDEYYEYLDRYATLAKDILCMKRSWLEKNLKANLYPWTKRYLKRGYSSHFSTIGLCGGHEACVNLLGKGINTPEGLKLMKDTLNYLRKKVSDFQEETGTLFNLEAAPAEGAGYRLARVDRKMYGDDIYISGTTDPYYTNSTALPVDATDDIFEALMHQNELQPLYSGGTVYHTLLGESVTDIGALKSYLIKAMTMTKLPYISITPTFSICPTCGFISGEHFTCPTCGNEDCEVYTRIVGYYRALTRWNKGKKSEYNDRITFDVTN
jgi:anaerobic ribonucleoside-triphosphate reductase